MPGWPRFAARDGPWRSVTRGEMGVADDELGSSSGPSRTRALPHYALPNFSVVLPTYSNQESDVITNAFRVGNFVSLHDLPHNVRPGQVSRSRFQKILDNRQESTENKQPHSKPAQFSTFEYVPSPYSVADDIARNERLRSVELKKAAGHTKPFMMSDTNLKLPHEDGFGGHFNPFKREADPYERADDEQLRWAWLQDALIMSAPFRPSGRVKGLLGQSASEIPGRQNLPEIVDRMRASIEEDWEEYGFLVRRRRQKCPPLLPRAAASLRLVRPLGGWLSGMRHIALPGAWRARPRSLESPCDDSLAIPSRSARPTHPSPNPNPNPNPAGLLDR